MSAGAIAVTVAGVGATGTILQFAGNERAEENRRKAEGEAETAKKPTSPNQMQNQVKRGQAPKGVDRVDPADTNIPDSQPHIHFGENEAALNQDGTWHDAGKPHPTINNKIAEWILENGWNLPTE